MKLWAKTVWAAAAVLFLFAAGCGKEKVDEEMSPELISASVDAYNEGSESKQYVEVDLEFDQEILVKEKRDDSLRITIAGERISTEEYELRQGENDTEAVLVISVDAVTNGILKVEKSERADAISDITNVTGEYAVKDFELESVIPSGVTLSDVSSDETSVTKQVDSAWSIRSIAWVCLTKNGEVIPVEQDDVNEKLDGRAAVHGHEFLIEDETEIAEKIAETLNRVYGAEYRFTCEENRITAESITGEAADYDIEVYQYLKINGQEISVEDEADPEEAEESEHEIGLKSKVPEIDREVTEEEQSFLDKLHISALESVGEIADGTDIYQTLTITGDAMGEEEVYSVRDLEELIRLSFQNQSMNELGLPKIVSASLGEQGETSCYGLDLSKFLALCGVDTGRENLYLTVEQKGGSGQTLDLGDLIQKGADILLVFGTESGPLSEDDTYLRGQIGLVCLNGDNEENIGSVYRLIVSTEENGEDTYYRFHNREPFIQDLDKTFTVEVYKEGAEYLGAVNQRTFTIEEFEQLMKDNPDHIVRNYYGTIANAESYIYMGNGGWLDFFEGLDLKWLLTEQMGLESLSGYAELYGRDQELYGRIDDLYYLFGDADDSDYYTVSADGIRVPNAVPMIACTKNGYPLLPEHDHESSGYIAYNSMNDQLQGRGIETEIGVIKNHSGPFIGCFGNLDGYYGGYQVETGGDCVLIKIYLT